MTINNRVVWSEGLFLRPQHFQQQARSDGRFKQAPPVFDISRDQGRIAVIAIPSPDTHTTTVAWNRQLSTVRMSLP